MRKLILDSLAYWVEEMHVDGFRFDLAPVLGVADGEYGSWEDPANTVLQEIIDHPVLRRYNTRVIAEPWSIRHFKLGGFPRSSDDSAVAWYDWNANFRDVWRSFVNYDDRPLNGAEGPIDIGGALTGAAALFGGGGRRPYHSVNFITVHDGFTMYDLLSFEHKVNGCGVLNPTCCDMRLSPFCDKDSGDDHNRSRDWGQDNEHLKRQNMRNLFVAMMISHGTPMLYGGDEWMRTQFGNNNAYSTGADNHWNWFDWGTWSPASERNRMHDFVRQLIRFRKEHAYALAPERYDTAAPFSWKTATNGDMEAADWSGRHTMVHYHDSSVGPQLVILINMEPGTVDFSLPAPGVWHRLIDTQSHFDTEPFLDGARDPRVSWNIELSAPEVIDGGQYGVSGRSIVVLEEAR